jgi:hypothetical protein
MTLPKWLVYRTNRNQYPNLYAVCVDTSTGPYVVGMIVCSARGDVYYNIDGRREFRTHGSYHHDGTVWVKTSGHVAFDERSLQRPDAAFIGHEHFIQTSIREGDAEAINIRYESGDFTGSIHVPASALVRAPTGNNISVHLVASGIETLGLAPGGVHLDAQQRFSRAPLPDVVISLYQR